MAETIARVDLRSAAGNRRRFSVHLLRTYGMVFALILVWGVFAVVTDGVFIEPRNLSNLIDRLP